jgi:hypothetical protein
VTVLLGGISTQVLGTALTPGNAGVYQIAIQVPTNAPNGDLPIAAQVVGAISLPDIHLPVQLDRQQFADHRAHIGGAAKRGVAVFELRRTP